MKFLDLKHMYDLRTKMKLKFGLSQSEYVSDVGQATSVLEKKILASRSHVISEGTSCPQPPYPPFDLVRGGIGEPHCSTCRFTISLDVPLASMTKIRVFRAGSKRFL